MQQLILLLVLGGVPLTPVCATQGQYRHKSEAQIAGMSPSERINEYANEQAYHKYDLSDRHFELLLKYIRRDGSTGVGRIIEIMDEYDPTGSIGKGDDKGERFDAMWELFSDLDERVVRLRASAAGVHAMDALGRAIDRMRSAGYGRKDQHEWTEHGRFESAETVLQNAKGINEADDAIRATLRIKNRISISAKELVRFTNFLIARDPSYPSWSERDFIEDYRRINADGNPAQVFVFKQSEKFHKAYLEFRKQNR